MKPARAVFGEDLLPVDVSRLELTGRAVAAIGASDRAADSKTALGEIETVAHRAPDSIVGNPTQIRLVNAALINQVLDQATHWVFRQRRNHRGIQAEAPLQPARNV